MQKPLESLILPLSKTDFLKSYLSNRSVIVHDLGESIGEILNLPFLESLEALLNLWPHTVDVHLPDVSDEASSIETNTEDARKLFANGMGLLFNDVNRISPILSEWLEALKLQLGLSTMTYARNLIYATPSNKGNAAHFDQNINFVLQIHGTKTWWVAPNEHVVNPMTRHTIGRPICPELESYSHHGMPDEMPENASSYVLRPGTMLFVPRGSWHKTLAQTDALSLNFTFGAPTWIDILTAALRGRLAQSPEWRGTADFVTDTELFNQAIDQFDGLLAELTYDLPNWRASDILRATEQHKFPL